MRYIRVKKITQKLCDTIVNEQPAVKEILTQIMARNLYCSMIVEGKSQYCVLDKVRILDVLSDGFKYASFRGNISVKDSCKYESLRELKVESEVMKEVTSVDEPQDDRWSLLDLN